MCAYAKGKRFGFAVFRNQVEVNGKAGVAKADKACMTCNKYARTGRKNGRRLSKDERSFYRGAVDGFLEFARKH